MAEVEPGREEEGRTFQVAVAAGRLLGEEGGGTVPVEGAASAALRPYRSWLEGDIDRQGNLTGAV